MSYRSDSDVVAPISGKIEPLDDPSLTQLLPRYEVQHKIAAWVVTDDDCSISSESLIAVILTHSMIVEKAEFIQHYRQKMRGKCAN